ncbi:MAG: IS1634 family transposase, partial [Holosporales bacterium]|nr:IS1634 family transposase [Holosporales bacterium]
IGPNNDFLPNSYYKGLLLRGTPEKPAKYPSREEIDDATLEYKIMNSGKIVLSSSEDKQSDTELYYGAVYLLEQIGGPITGVEEDLALCFPSIYKQLLSIIYFLILESHIALYRFERWHFDHKHPFGTNLSSQKISELLIYGITEEQKNNFFRLQAARRVENEYLAYDTTSISSYSEWINSAKFGRNKDLEKLRQVNLAMVIGEQSRLPVYYRMLPGNISDVSALAKLPEDMDFLNVPKYKLVLDRGFYSANNLNLLYKYNYNFIISARKNIKWLRNISNQTKILLPDSKINAQNYDPLLDVYHIFYKKTWEYKYIDSSGIIKEQQDREILIHIFYNETRGNEEKRRFLKSIHETKQPIKNGEPLRAEQVSLCKKYLLMKKSQDGIINDVANNSDAINEKCLDFGYFVLLTNKNEFSHDILSIYRQKDLIEKSFDNIKDHLNLKITELHSDLVFNNRLFVSFISLIYLSYIDKKMKENSLYKNTIMDKLFDDLDVIKICNHHDKPAFISEITDK